jgi:plastocyanin
MVLKSRHTSAIALLVASGLTLAACSGSSHPAASGATTSTASANSANSAASTASANSANSAMPGMSMSGTPTTGSAGSDTVPVAGNAVAIKNFAFAPEALTVKVGTTVTWTNQDSDAHTVTSQGSGGPLSSAALATGQSYSYTFTKPGTYSYLCTIHPFMTATVTVTQ